jgi:aflatoxin B1 aldehyde reductase
MGAMSIDNMAKFGTPQAVKELLDLFYTLDYGNLDTARGYSPHAPGTSEPLLGAVDGGKRFNASTKIYPYEIILIPGQELNKILTSLWEL